MELFIILVWLCLSIAVGGLAQSKGREGFGWFVVALLISPLLALIVIACVPTNSKEIDRRALKGGKMKRCPACREIVSKKAAVCRACRHNFDACRCPSCLAPFVYESQRAGQTVRCGACHVSFQYPTL